MSISPLPPNYLERARVARLLVRVRNCFLDDVNRELATFDLSSAHYAVISMLALGQARSAAGICKEISYDPGAMTRIIDRLEQRQLLRRIPSREDRRKQELELTDRGREFYPEVQARSTMVLERLMATFTQAELSTLEELLGRMAANMERG